MAGGRSEVWLCWWQKSSSFSPSRSAWEREQLFISHIVIGTHFLDQIQNGIPFEWPYCLCLWLFVGPSFDLAGHCFCVRCKLAIRLSHYHSNGNCDIPVRRSWPFSVEQRMLLCYTLKDHLQYLDTAGAGGKWSIPFRWHCACPIHFNAALIWTFNQAPFYTNTSVSPNTAEERGRGYQDAWVSGRGKGRKKKDERTRKRE